MSNKSIIKPYTDHIIDCYQNLIMTILNHDKQPVLKLGATWPWSFIVDVEKTSIYNQIMTSHEQVRQLFSYDIVKQKLEEKCFLKELDKILRYYPVIVNVDQFYVKHHYSHIYMKEHGIHSLLIFKKRTDAIYCIIDCLPAYQGEISAENLMQAIDSLPSDELRYEITFCKPVIGTVLTNQDIYQRFIRSSDEDITPYSINRLYELLNEEVRNNNSNDFLYGICNNSNWIWEAERKASITKAYILAYNEFNNNIITSEICTLIDDINAKFALSIKKMFKSCISPRRQYFQAAFDLMREACLIETQFIEKLRMKG